jgi:hypothetical protein
MDATDNELVEAQYYGCCVVELYNRGRPHASLGPGIPDPPRDRLAPSSSGHRVRDDHRVVAKAILGGLHHEYRLEPIAA